MFCRIQIPYDIQRFYRIHTRDLPPFQVTKVYFWGGMAAKRGALRCQR